MPLAGDYQFSSYEPARRQAERILSAGTTDGETVMDRPLVLLVTRGARSGDLRPIPLMRVEHDGRYAVVASMGGARRNPAWYRNVVAEPQVELVDGAVRRDYRAREVSGAERAEWWDRAVTAFPPYAEYQAATQRTIPVFVLEQEGE